MDFGLPDTTPLCYIYRDSYFYKKSGKVSFVWAALPNIQFVYVTPQTRGSVDYPSTRGIQVDVGLPDATSENRAESPLYGELYPNTKPAYPVPNSAI